MSIKQSVPNALTAARIGLIPIICLLVFAPAEWGWAAWGAFGLYAFAAISDFLDGWLARLWNVHSVFGRIFDPIADKLLVGALSLCLVADGRIVTLDLIPVVAILLRELLVSGLREYLAPLGTVLPVSPLAKWKTTAQFVALGLLLLTPVLPVLTIGLIVLWLAAGLSLYTAWGYGQATFAAVRS